MPTNAKVVLTHISASINQKMLAASLNHRNGLMISLDDITYDNIYIGAEVRDLTTIPPILGFIVDIEEYGWADDFKGNCVAFSYFITVKNCDGNYYEFDMAETTTLKLVVRTQK